MSTLNEEIWARFLTGECTADELRTINTWLAESEENATRLFELEELYQLGKLGSPSDDGKRVRKAEERLFRRLERERQEQDKATEKEDKEQGRPRRRWSLRQTWMKVAAVVTLVLLLGSGGYYFLASTLAADEPLLAVSTGNDIREVELPDGTRVWLNRHTTLRYPRHFAADGRRVYLEGEGYFEVKRDSDRPFVVRSEAMQVRVLGTVFNLKVDETSRSAVATLLKGEIEVKGNHDEGMVVLAPGQRAELNGLSRRLVVKQGDTGFESWHSRQFIFDKADIFTIARTLEQSYGVKVILSPDINVQKTYTGALPRKDNVEEVLGQLGNVIPVSYKIVGSSVFLSAKKRK